MIKLDYLKGTLVLVLAAVIAWSGCEDEDKGTDPQNHPPVITSIEADPDTFYAEDTTTITVIADDADGDALSYAWETGVSWLMPVFGQDNVLGLTNCCPIIEPGTTYIVATVSDDRGGQAHDSVQIWILPAGS